MSFESVAPVLFESVSAVTATPSVELGTVATINSEKYVYVYNAGTSASPGVALIRPASCAAGLYSCSVSSVSGDMAIGFVKHAAIASGSYGWALTNGNVAVLVASSSSDVAAGSVGLGVNGVIKTHTSGFCVGQITTAIVSGNTGVLRVKV